MEIREVRPSEYETLGAVTLEAYTTLDGHVPDRHYEAELADVATRATVPGATVLVAVDGDGAVLGGVTYIGDHESPLAEYVPEGGAGIRMLAVAVAAQGRGVGEALTQACIDRARAEGKDQVVLHSTPWMTTAHRLYDRLGFVREPESDWPIFPSLTLWFFRLRF